MTNKSVKVGITGSIGMGKTTVSLEVTKQNYPVWQADEVVHTLYKKGNQGYKIIQDFIPEVAIGPCINRELLSKVLLKEPSLINKIEAALKPIITEKRRVFLQQNRNKKFVFLDIPLLFETNSDDWLDCVIVVTAPFSVQKKRVLSRENMTEEKFLFLLSRQISNEEKIIKADFVINTNCEYELMVSDIKVILERISNEYT